MSKLDKDTVLDNFTKAYTKANGKAPSIEAKGGWYSVDGGKNMRLAQLDEMVAELGAAKAEKKAAKPVKKAATEKVPAAKKAVEKKAPAAKKAPATKKTSATKKKSSSKAFSVKDFYTQQILDANPGAKAPR